MLYEVTNGLKTKDWEITLAGRIRLQPFPESIIKSVLGSERWESQYQGWGRLITLLKQECEGAQIRPNWKIETSLLEHHKLTSKDNPTKILVRVSRKERARMPRQEDRKSVV